MPLVIEQITMFKYSNMEKVFEYLNVNQVFIAIPSFYTSLETVQERMF